MSENQKLQVEYFGLSHIGMVRTENQDSFGKYPEDSLDSYTDKGLLFVVADGMGGHTGGKQASSIAVNTVGKKYFESTLKPPEALKEAIVSANSEIHRTSESSSQHSTMGTTCTSMVLIEDKAIIGHVGDSRVYRIINDKIEQITDDHTKVQEMLKQGVLTPEEAKVYPSKSVLARALGVEKNVKVDILPDIPLKAGQIFLICSDGLAKVNENEIVSIISENSIAESCNKLVDLANERGGKDNVTVQLIKLSNSQSPVLTNKELKPASNNIKKILIPIIILIILILTGYQFRDSLSGLFSSDKVEENEVSGTDTSITNYLADIPETGKQSDLLKRANNYFNNGRIETALDLYKEILDEEPMNLAALQGINNIFTGYLLTAEKLMGESKFEDALAIYKRLDEIQPGNQKIINLIHICENQLNFGMPDQESSDGSESQLTIKGNNIVIVDKFLTGEWNFANLPANQYNLENNQIEFAASSIEKKSLFKQALSNAEISVELKSNLPGNKSMAGIICGYTSSVNHNSEDYYLISLQRNGLILKKISGLNSEDLLKMNSPTPDEKTAGFKLKILCSENKIFIFNDTRLLGNWEGSSSVEGKIGFIAGEDVHAKFSNLHLRGVNKFDR